MWQWDVSRWLVASGCRYMLAWDKECSAWDDAVDEADLERFDYGDIPDEEVVMTTRHEDDDLEEVFWFAKNRARHPAIDLNETLLIHTRTTSAQSSRNGMVTMQTNCLMEKRNHPCLKDFHAARTRT